RRIRCDDPALSATIQPPATARLDKTTAREIRISVTLANLNPDKLIPRWRIRKPQLVKRIARRQLAKHIHALGNLPENGELLIVIDCWTQGAVGDEELAASTVRLTTLTRHCHDAFPVKE